MKKDNHEVEKIKIGLLHDLDNIEDVHHILSEADLLIINNMFNNAEDFYQIVDSFERVLYDKIIDKKDFRKVLNSISKIVNYRIITQRSKEPKKKRSLLFRLLFELPELINNTK